MANGRRQPAVCCLPFQMEYLIHNSLKANMHLKKNQLSTKVSVTGCLVSSSRYLTLLHNLSVPFVNELTASVKVTLSQIQFPCLFRTFSSNCLKADS